MKKIMTSAFVVAALALSIALPAVSQAKEAEIGTIASIDGTAEVGRDGDWLAAEVGTPIHANDLLRTGKPGHMRVVFDDDSVLTLGDASELKVSEHVFAPEQGETRSLVDLLSGTVNAVVSEYYQKPNAAYEVKTKTATAGVRGTEFVVSYEPGEKLTEVFVVDGRVEVTSLVEDVQDTVFLNANEVTYVRQGELPSAPNRYEEGVLRQRLDSIDFIGERGFEGLAARSLVSLNVRSSRPSAATASGSSDLSRKHIFEANDLLGQNSQSVGRRSLGIRF
jgi:ferric-dicitrate binding protein FerR (iron transport regulator)